MTQYHPERAYQTHRVPRLSRAKERTRVTRTGRSSASIIRQALRAMPLVQCWPHNPETVERGRLRPSLACHLALTARARTPPPASAANGLERRRGGRTPFEHVP